MDKSIEPAPSDPAHWLIERRVRVYSRILLVMFLLAVPLYAITFQGGLDSKGRPMGTDFIAFWSAARVTVEGLAVDPWSLRELEGFQLARFPGLAGPTAWVYPPTTLIMVWPLGHLPFSSAFITWTVIGLIAFALALRPVIRGQKYAWVIAAAFPGLWLGIAHGQTQFVVAALMGGALVLVNRHPYAAGVLIGLMAIKPHLAILFPLALVAGGYWRTFATAAATAVGFLGISVLVFGPETFWSWIDGMGLISSAIDSEALPVYKYVTPYTALRLVGLPEAVSFAIHVAVALPAAWIVCSLWRHSVEPAIRGSALVLGTFLVTPYAADYDLAMLAFPIAWMALLGLRHGWHRGDRNLLVMTWVLPWVAAPIAVITHLGVVPLMMSFLLRQLWVRSKDPVHVSSTTHSAEGGR